MPSSGTSGTLQLLLQSGHCVAGWRGLLSDTGYFFPQDPLWLQEGNSQP